LKGIAEKFTSNQAVLAMVEFSVAPWRSVSQHTLPNIPAKSLGLSEIIR